MEIRQQRWRSNPEVIEALEQLGVTEINDLAQLVQSPDDEQALKACWLLGQIKDKRYSQVLAQTLSGDRPALWMQSAVALSLLDSKRPTRRLLALLLDVQRAVEHRYAAAYALAFTPCALQDPDVGIAFLTILRDQQTAPNVRGAVAEGVANMFSGCFVDKERQGSLYEEMGQTLITLLDDSAPEVRFWSAFALGSMRYRRALPKLQAIATTDIGWFGGWWTVGEEASDAIDRIEGREPPERACLTEEEAINR